MKAQDFYDWREDTEEISGSDLHDFFQTVLREPSPNGHVEVSLPPSSYLHEYGEWAREIYDRVAMWVSDQNEELL